MHPPAIRSRRASGARRRMCFAYWTTFKVLPRLTFELLYRIWPFRSSSSQAAETQINRVEGISSVYSHPDFKVIPFTEASGARACLTPVWERIVGRISIGSSPVGPVSEFLDKRDDLGFGPSPSSLWEAVRRGQPSSGKPSTAMRVGSPSVAGPEGIRSLLPRLLNAAGMYRAGTTVPRTRMA
jgi:hypothetical protein